MGKPKAACSEACRATSARGKLPSLATSGIQAGRPEDQILPGSPTPRGKLMLRVMFSKAEQFALGRIQIFAQRSTSESGSIIHRPPKVQSNDSHAARNTLGTASLSAADATSTVLTASRTAKRRRASSLALRAVDQPGHGDDEQRRDHEQP